MNKKSINLEEMTKMNKNEKSDHEHLLEEHKR